MTLGFIGTGAITEAMVTGLREVGDFTDPILLSERSKTRSARLAGKYPAIKVLSENQKIVDRSSIVVVAVLPEQVEEVLSSLEFQLEKLILNVAAGVSVDAIKKFTRSDITICSAVPMPTVAFGQGPIPLYPTSKQISEVLDRIGTVIELKEENHMQALTAASAQMAPFFYQLSSSSRWLEQQGLSPEQGAKYNTTLFQSLATQANNADIPTLHGLSKECQTPGGLNEQLIDELSQNGWFRALEDALDNVLKRLK